MDSKILQNEIKIHGSKTVEKIKSTKLRAQSKTQGNHFYSIYLNDKIKHLKKRVDYFNDDFYRSLENYSGVFNLLKIDFCSQYFNLYADLSNDLQNEPFKFASLIRSVAGRNDDIRQLLWEIERDADELVCSFCMVDSTDKDLDFTVYESQKIDYIFNLIEQCLHSELLEEIHKIYIEWYDLMTYKTNLMRC